MNVKFILPLLDLSATVHFFKSKISRNSRLTSDANIIVMPEDPKRGRRDKPQQQSGDMGYPVGRNYPEDESELKAAEAEQFQMPYIQGRYSRGRNPDPQKQF